LASTAHIISVGAEAYTFWVDKRIRKQVLRRLREYPLFQDEALYLVISRDLNVPQGDVVRVVGFMHDTGEVETVSNNVRLKFVSSWWVRTLQYMGNNWIALAALAVSIAGVVIALFALWKGGSSS
jgi:hypothetical protein